MEKNTLHVDKPQRFFPYQKYRKSGVEWLGEIPAHWKWQRLRHACKRITDGSHLSPPAVIDGHPYVTVRDLVDGKVDVDNAARISEEDFRSLERNGCRPRIGDVLFSKDGTVGKVALVERDDFVVLSSLAILYPGPYLLSSFLFQFLSSASGILQIESKFAGAALRRITLDVIVDLVASIPPMAEQGAIASFLDRETAKIDTLVEKKEKLIELLKEKRAALITKAVTKGLDATVPMKDSGVEWLGKIPAHWEVMKITWLFSIGSGTTPRSEDLSYYGGDTPWITTSELRESVLLSAEKNVTEDALREHSSLKVHPKGSVVVAMYGATIGRLGILGVPAAVNQACCVFSKPVRIDTWFWFYWLQMRRSHLISLGYGGGQPNLSQDLLRSMRVPTPPLSEQKAIVAFLNRETVKIDALAEKIQKGIDLLKEYRSALISATVTGKIDVRGGGDFPDKLT